MPHAPRVSGRSGLQFCAFHKRTPERGKTRCIAPLFALSLAVLIGSGCSGEREAYRTGRYGRVVTPLPPAFITGAAALLLTNNPGFSARVELQTDSSMGTRKTSTGALLGRNGKLLYAPDSDEATEPRQPGEYSFIWDVAQSQGYVLSEALQGYAPVNSALHVTNLQTSGKTTSSEKVAGHSCEGVIVTAITAEGSTNSFDVLRAVDLSGFPLRIESSTNAAPFVLSLSKIKFEAPSASIFSPPDGFTKYPSAQTMADELAAREHNLRRKSQYNMDEVLMPEPRRY